MEIEIWLAFVAASAALLMVPGPVVMLLFAQTLAHGRSVSWAAIPGVILGDFVAMSVSLLGAGALLASSTTLFMLLKICGAIYLVWLGINIWRTGLKPLNIRKTASPRSRWIMFRQAFIITALNPKDIVFFVAFLPQFINQAQPSLIQITILEATFLLMVLVSTSAWVFAIGFAYIACDTACFYH